MGGVWKRQIRAVKARNYIYNSLVRGALKTFFKLHGKSLDDEVSAIVNSRTMKTETITS